MKAKSSYKIKMAILVALSSAQMVYAADFIGETGNGIDSTLINSAMVPNSKPQYIPPSSDPDPSGHTDYIGYINGTSKQGDFVVPISGLTSVKFLIVGGGGGGARSGAQKGGSGGASGAVLRGQLPISDMVDGYYYVVGNAGMGSCGMLNDGNRYKSTACLDTSYLDGYAGGESSIRPKSNPNAAALAAAAGGQGGTHKAMGNRYGGNGESAPIGGQSGLTSVGGAGGSNGSVGGKMGDEIGAGGGGGASSSSDGINWYQNNGGAGTPGIVRFCWGTDPSCD